MRKHGEMRVLRDEKDLVALERDYEEVGVDSLVNSANTNSPRAEIPQRQLA